MAEQCEPGDYLRRSAHPSAPFRWVTEHATSEAVMWAIELTEAERRRQFLELACLGPIAQLDGDVLARFAALLVVAQDRRLLGLS
jgi:hypothetical protein